MSVTTIVADDVYPLLYAELVTAGKLLAIDDTTCDDAVTVISPVVVVHVANITKLFIHDDDASYPMLRCIFIVC